MKVANQKRCFFEAWCLVLLASGVLGPTALHAQPAESASAADAPVEKAELKEVRFFREVHAKGFPGTYQALSRLGYNGDFVLLVETDARRRPVGDTLLTWVQHYGPGQELARQAAWADLVITCHPELLSEADRANHVLPGAQGKVWIYFIKNRHLIVTDLRQPALEFAESSP